MAKLSNVVDVAAKAIGWDVGEVRHYARRAREGGELTSTGARGNAAANAITRDASNILIACMSATYAKDAPARIRECRDMIPGRVFNDDEIQLTFTADATWVSTDVAHKNGYSPQTESNKYNFNVYINTRNALLENGDGSKQKFVQAHVLRLPFELGGLAEAKNFGSAIDYLIDLAVSGDLHREGADNLADF